MQAVPASPAIFPTVVGQLQDCFYAVFQETTQELALATKMKAICHSFFFFHLSFLMEGPAPSDVDTIQGDFHFTTILQFGLLAFLGPHLVSSALTPGFSLELGCLEAKST